MSDDHHQRRSRNRTMYEVGGAVVGLLAAYFTRNAFGFQDTISAWGYAVLCAIGGALLASGVYSLIYGKDQAPGKDGKDQGPGAEDVEEGHFKTIRETAESIVIALILAFLFRSFEAEAFVIPTGSMAPTLMGRHYDLVCPECDASYRTGASIENAENGSNQGIVVATHSPYYRDPLRIPYEFNERAEAWQVSEPTARLPDGGVNDLRSFNGDRIIVSKFVYEFSDPKRWDVIVFKYPGNPKQNYIKRLVGLPNETVRITRGDIFVVRRLFNAAARCEEALDRGEVGAELRSLFEQNKVELSDQLLIRTTSDDQLPDREVAAEWQIHDVQRGTVFHVRKLRYQDELEVSAVTITRKPPYKLKAMLQRVDDTRYIPQVLIKQGWPTRWQPWRPADTPGANPWKVLDDGHEFEVQAPAGKAEELPVAWLCYQHFVPDWVTTQPPAERPGQLITDYYVYNDAASEQLGQLYPFNPIGPQPDQISELPQPEYAGQHWVGDLAVEADVTLENGGGYVWLQLIEGGRPYHCRINLADGTATLSIDGGNERFTGEGLAEGVPELVAATPVRGAGTYRLRLANCDDQLTLWVNERVQRFRDPKSGKFVDATYANPPDCQPIFKPEQPGDLMPVGIGSQGATLHVDRIRVKRDIYYIASTSSSGRAMMEYGRYWDPAEVQRIFRSPDEWSTTELFAQRGSAEFSMQADQFFPLGDNSPASKDGRLWDDPRYVERRFLTGKALFVYWPHSWDRPLPFFPNFRRMGFVR